nr:MAG TPA: hypothetical protein [Caudoviricetes sp.]
MCQIISIITSIITSILTSILICARNRKSVSKFDRSQKKNLLSNSF